MTGYGFKKRGDEKWVKPRDNLNYSQQNLFMDWMWNGSKRSQVWGVHQYRWKRLWEEEV